MSIKTAIIYTKLVVSISAFFVITVITSLIWYLVGKFILAKLSFIPETIRLGFENPYLSYLGLTVFFVLLSFITFELANYCFARKNRLLSIKVLLGLFSGLLPICILNSYAYGLFVFDPAILSELFFLGLSGAVIPLVKSVISLYLEEKTTI